MLNTETPKSRLILIRHGETLANKQHLLQGASDGPLTASGREQVDKLGQHLRSFQIDHVISSDLIRAHHTAMAIAKHHGLEVEVTPLIREWHIGEWDARPAEIFLKMLADSGKPVSAFKPEDGETLWDVHQRASEFLSGLLANHRGQCVVVCSHGDFMRMLTGCLLNVDLEQAGRFYFDNASYSMFEYEGPFWKAMAINRLPDLERERF